MMRSSRAKTLAFVGAALACVAALAVGVWWALGTPGRVDSAPSPLPSASGPTVEATVGPNASLPPVAAGSSGCARMDEVLSSLMGNLPQARALFGADGRSASREEPDLSAWADFLGALREHRAEFEQAAEGDREAERSLEALDTVTRLQPQLIDGTIPLYDDPPDAREQLAAGRTPSQSEAYPRATQDVSVALDRLVWCLPTWPVSM